MGWGRDERCEPICLQDDTIGGKIESSRPTQMDTLQPDAQISLISVFCSLAPSLTGESRDSDVCSRIRTGLLGRDREVRLYPGCHDVRNKMVCAVMEEEEEERQKRLIASSGLQECVVSN